MYLHVCIYLRGWSTLKIDFFPILIPSCSWIRSASDSAGYLAVRAFIRAGHALVCVEDQAPSASTEPTYNEINSV